MCRVKLYGYFLVLLILQPLQFYDLTGQDPLKKFFFSDNEQKSVTIPFRFINNLIVIPISINSSDTLNFILDTGVNTTILSELNWQDSLSLVFAKQIELQGLGQGKPVEALHSFGNNISISDITGKNQDIYVLLESSFNLSAKMGISVNGIIGFPVFQSFIVEINYPDKIITFYKREAFNNKKKGRGYTTLPITINDTKPYLTIRVADDAGNIHTVKLLIDTGASHAIWLDENTLEGISKPETQKYSFLGAGLNGMVFGETMRFQFVDIYGFKLMDPIISFPDSVSLAYASGIDLRNGSMGSDILRRFNLIIDYANSQLKIKPNKFFNDPFTQNLSGMEIIAPYAGLKLYFVENVIEGSPAWNAGIRNNDELVSINNIPVTQMEMNEIYEILQSRPGKKIRVKFYRLNQLMSVSFKLEENV